MPRPTLYRNNAQLQGVFENLQDMLIRRFRRTPKALEPIVYEFTDDKAILHQYFILRERMLGTDKFLPKGVVPQDVHDKISHILIARRGTLCIGGARLTIREGDEAFPLPMESDDFKLRELFPDLPLDRERHAVVSKFTILDHEKNHDILYALCKIMYEKVIQLNIQYLFARATNMTLARNWRLIGNMFCPKSTRICTEIDVPDSPMYPGETQRLMYSDLGAVIQTPAQLESTPRQKPDQPKLALVH